MSTTLVNARNAAIAAAVVFVFIVIFGVSGDVPFGRALQTAFYFLLGAFVVVFVLLTAVAAYKGARRGSD